MAYRVDCSFAGETTALASDDCAVRLFPTIGDAFDAAGPYREDGYDIAIVDHDTGGTVCRWLPFGWSA